MCNDCVGCSSPGVRETSHSALSLQCGCVVHVLSVLCVVTVLVVSV